MSLSAVLSSILHGQINFCCVCFGDVGKDALYIDGDVFIDGDHSETVTHITAAVFGGEMETVSAFGTFCKKCKTQLVTTYKFIQKCKNNCARLSSAIASLQGSAENTLLNTDMYKSLFITMDVNRFTSQQFYDSKKLHNSSKAFKRFSSIVNLKQDTNIEKRKQKIELVDKTLQEYKLTCQKLKLKNWDLIDYDISTIPTKTMVYDETDITDFTCKVCQKKFLKEYELRFHFFNKHFPKNFKCSSCSNRFITEQLLKSHEARHKPGVCSQCGKHFSTLDKLHKHELSHIIQIVCQECSRTYRSKEAFKKHIADNICQQKSKKNSQEGIYQCDICKKRYWIKPYLAKHIKYEHGNATGYKCKYCHKQFYTPSRLETHLVKHTGEKNFVCSLCGGKFVTKSSLLYHTRLHTGERPYKCDYCDSAFLSASRRLDHMRRHHMPPSLKCEFCNTMFKSSGSLLKHKKRHLNPSSRLNGGPRLARPVEIETTEGQPTEKERTYSQVLIDGQKETIINL